jgi:ATP-binding cassette subfamily C protein CydC
VTPLRRILSQPGTPYGRLALAGLLGFASAAATIGLLAGSGYVIGRAAFRPGLGALVGILAAVEVAAFLRGPLRYAERLIGHDAALRALARWRVWLYDCLTPRVPAALSGWRSGDLLTRAIDDVDTLQDLYLRTVLPLAIAVATAILGLIVVGLVLPIAALVMGVALVVAAVVPAAMVWRSAREEESAALAGAVSAQVVDLIHGAADLLAFGADVAAVERLNETRQRAETMERRRAGIASWAGLVTQVCAGLATTGVLALAVASVHARHLEPVMVAVLPLAVLAAFEPIPGVAQAVARSLAASAAARRLLALEDVPIPVVDAAHPFELAGGIPEIQFVNASLRYSVGLPLALDGVDLTLAPGARLAVTGASGAGKSSVVNALIRFWGLESGQLSLAGQSVTQLAQADVRAAVALVDQRTHLFAGTIASNVVLGRPDASDEDVAAALEAAQLTEWVMSLPQGIDTPIGEEGVTVSGGERRRLVVARALLAGGQILVLDEPTSGLNAGLADQLLHDVMAAAGERSVLLITHRPLEAQLCDEILRLSSGRVVS